MPSVDTVVLGTPAAAAEAEVEEDTGLQEDTAAAVGMLQLLPTLGYSNFLNSSL